MSSKSVGIAIITHQAKHHLPHCLPPLLASPRNPRILVVNSSSEDGTVEAAEELGAETLVVPRASFNHGSTRELARKRLNTDTVLMMTPDAYATDSSLVETLIAPIESGKAAVAYARQTPQEGADLFETFHRTFNYPEKGHIRSLEDSPSYGMYLFFCSNACAAYSNAALQAIGGFSPVLLGEDTLAVAKLLRNGEKIAYVAEATVRHSHRYNLKQEFCRSFDTGLARQEYRHLIKIGGYDTSLGVKYVKNLLTQLAKEKPWLLPYGVFHSFTKWVAYQIGALSPRAPLWFKRALSSQDFYWK